MTFEKVTIQPFVNFAEAEGTRKITMYEDLPFEKFTYEIGGIAMGKYAVAQYLIEMSPKVKIEAGGTYVKKHARVFIFWDMFAKSTTLVLLEDVFKERPDLEDIGLEILHFTFTKRTVINDPIFYPKVSDCAKPHKFGEEICKAQNPYNQLYSYTVNCVEEKLVTIAGTIVVFFIKNCIAITKETFKRDMDSGYIFSKLQSQWSSIANWNETDEKEKQKLCEQHRQQYIEMGKQSRVWYDYVKNYPLCLRYTSKNPILVEAIRKIQLDTINLAMELVKWALTENTTVQIKWKIKEWINKIGISFDMDTKAIFAKVR